MTQKPPFKWGDFWGAIFMIVFAGGFATFGGYQLWTTHAFLQDAVPMPGIVTENVETCDDDDECTYWPRIKLTLPSGQEVMTKTRYGTSSYDWKEGSEIDTLYNPAYSYVRIPGASNLYLLGGGFFGLGMFTILVAIWFLIVQVFFPKPPTKSDRSRP